ncbi:D-alanyl-D-alanine carboxypeptidase/D-alanyl-D-alanine endopeptidase [Roseobacter sinensis]|uniref:D-alanyl-D-alanine carboxypeptidase/D-alanyl-D-alanine-endopeptidase n=1 Tax=Roseobacter sinensis TaxID=2931391 RepID=A0ABT3BE86_9RHOB|nr:D-alanyl-D-alanine carboxypeptidase/D-alanyl-D-alanine-endopeptidase [Roseobacter sp. WL0113]MCV3271523.1 D-alanyl-D-alanine carboxypeptidase/D-alanyl-D-alanine-endopeptidase [Roseobacter sp. WL0113]
MSKRSLPTLSRRGFLAGAMAGVALPVSAEAPAVSLRPRLRDLHRGRTAGLDRMLRDSGVSGQVVFAVGDAETGALLEGRRTRVGIAPASVTKAITALYALDVLGAQHRFVTEVVADGTLESGVLQGDLVLVGGCDPTLDTRALAGLAAQLKDAGLREVRGRFLVYEDALRPLRSIDPEQPDHLGYSPAVSGIALNYNRVHFEWKREAAKTYKVTMDARTAGYRPDVTVARMTVVDRSLPVYTYEDAETHDQWTVARGALGTEGARWLPVRRPGLYAGDVFATLARSHGIVLKTPEVIATRPEGTLLGAVNSPPLREILHGMLKYSNNLTAEMVGQAATRARAGRPHTLAASARQMNLWAMEALGMENPAFVDHSGLGSGSRVSAQDMLLGLTAAHRNATLRPILKPVTMRDAKGRPVEDHPVKVDAKTGTLNFVSGLAGYITAPGGREMVFAIFCADEDIRATITRANRERPEGARPWANRARRLQRALLARWGETFDEAQTIRDARLAPTNP